MRPKDTFNWLKKSQQIAGVTRVADITELDRIGIPVFQAVRPMGRSLTVSQGKGDTKDAARTSALMESIEIWHAETEKLPGLKATKAELAGKRYLDPGHLLRPGFCPASDDRSFEWTEGTDCEDGETVLIPRDAGNLDFTRDADPAWLMRSTDGLAGGNTRGEALSSALAEVIERSCRAEFEGADARYRAKRRLDPALVAYASPRIGHLVAAIAGAGLELELFEMTNVVGVTAIRATIFHIKSAGTVPHPCVGHGAHLDPETAVIRAVTEAAQARLTHISGNRDDLDPKFYENAQLSNISRTIERNMDLAGSRRGLDLSDASAVSPDADFDKMLEMVLEVGGGPVSFLDLTRDDLNVPVVKVFAPSLKGGLRGRSPSSAGRSQ